jgi:glyoxylase-like metal-dependent hydrolase (beta-lactamase superfamily II)
MKTTRHTPNLVRLTRLGAVNAYLVVEDDGLTLVDTMIPRSQDAILAAARDLGRPIARIVLTHAHADHVGSLDALAAALPNATVAISTRDARFLAGDKSLDPDEPQSKLRGGYPELATKPGLLLDAGDRVGSLEVIAAPGHTPGHIALLDTRDPPGRRPRRRRRGARRGDGRRDREGRGPLTGCRAPASARRRSSRARRRSPTPRASRP